MGMNAKTARGYHGTLLGAMKGEVTPERIVKAEATGKAIDRAIRARDAKARAKRKAARTARRANR